MKRTVLTVLLLCGGLLFGLRGSAEARVSIGVSVDFFYDSLSPYGSWIDSPRYGQVWAPRHVARGWRPYVYGRWVYTDYGWTWVSNERWAWATYHYGRWYHDPYDGWLWVPGDEWAPAWVDWRWGDDYVGWAPLPPGGDPFRAYDYGLDPFAYSFVRVGSFFDPGLSRRVLPVSRNPLLLRETQPVGGYARVGGQVADRGIEPSRLLSRSGVSAVPRASLREVQSIDQTGAFRSGVLPVFRPRVEASRRVDPAGGGRVVAERPEDLARRQELQHRDSALRRGQAPPAATAPPTVGERERARRDAEARAQAEHQQQDAVHRQERAQQERERLDGEAARRQDANRQRELARRQTEQESARQEQATRRQQQAEHEQQIRQRQTEQQQGRQQQIEREQRIRQQQQADAEQQRAARRQQQSAQDQQARQRQAEHDQQVRQQQAEREQQARQQQAQRDQQVRQQQAERERQAAAARERAAGQRPPQAPAQPPPAKKKHGDKKDEQ